MDKKELRQRRARRSRSKQKELSINRLVVHRTPRHIYAQVIAADGTKILAAASTLEKSIRAEVKDNNTGNIEAAEIVGKHIAERMLKKFEECENITVAFDRSGFKYHGRVKKLADAARKAGLHF